MQCIYERVDEMLKSADAAERIVAKLWKDLEGRSGGAEFDDDIKHEILDEWLGIVRGEIKP